MLCISDNLAGRSWPGIAIVTLLLLCLGQLTACSSSPRTTHEPRVIEDPALRDARIKEDISALRTEVETYFNRYSTLPRRLPDLRETPDGDALIDEIPRDPWSVPYLLRRLGDDVLIYSTGEDLLIGTEDDQGIRLSFEGVTPRAQDPASSAEPHETPLRAPEQEPQQADPQQDASDPPADDAPSSADQPSS